MKTDRARLRLIYEETDISKDIAGDFVSFEYTDNESGKADDISLTLKDENGLWHGAWFPTKGDVIKATIIEETDAGTSEMYCGRYSIDDLSFSGPPDKFEIKGVSVPLSYNIRREQKSRAWEDFKLSGIAQAIADLGGLQLIYDALTDPFYERIDQREESDLAFLNRLCESEGFSLKITDSQLVVFEQSKYDNNPIITTLTKGSSDIKSYSFQSQAYDLYSECTCSYFDPDAEELVEQTFKDPEIIDGMKTKLLKRAETPAEAERLAKAELRKLNRREVTGNMSIKGSIRFIAGVNIGISGFGIYDGRYLIEKATHSLGGGYTTSLELRRILEDY